MSFRRNRRGQSAIEYTMTYGWAILVIIIAAVILWRSGLLEFSRDVQPGSRGFSQIRPLDWKLSADGTLLITIENDAGSILVLPAGGVTASVLGGAASCTGSAPAADVSPFRPAAVQTVTLTGCGAPPGGTGTYYRANVSILYSNPGSGLNHQSVGILWGPLE
ncbi:Uncharacterised protein [uncultured archaeon]|nr:Uncharacterised protein [uncultured archaeon]